MGFLHAFKSIIAENGVVIALGEFLCKYVIDGTFNEFGAFFLLNSFLVDFRQHDYYA